MTRDDIDPDKEINDRTDPGRPDDERTGQNYGDPVYGPGEGPGEDLRQDGNLHPLGFHNGG